MGKSKSKSMSESLLFRALLRRALSKEGISLKADDDVVYPTPKSFYDKREDIPEYIKKEMKKDADAFAAAYADAVAVASKKDKFYELCGVSEGELRFDLANELKKMEREMYGDLELYGKKNEAIKKVEEFERERFFKIYGHPGGPENILPNLLCGIQRKGNSNTNNNSMLRSSSSSRILLFGG